MIIKDCTFETILIDSRFFRKGILMTLTNQEGKKTMSEISPLPGYSKETFEEALQQLQQLKRRLVTTWWTRQSLYYLENLGLYPSVFFGVETALLDLLDPILDTDIAPTYGFLFGTPDEILFHAQKVYEEGFRHAKVKLGHFTPEIAHRLIKELGDKFRLRVDLNRKWSFEEASKFCSHYPYDFFEYIEEPSSKYQDLLQFSYPFALDETLRQTTQLLPFLHCKHLKALIIKPTLIYPFHPLLNLVSAFNTSLQSLEGRKGPEIVLSSSFESSVGIAQIHRIVRRLGLENTYHGLDTLRYFDNYDDSVSDRILETATS